MNDLIANILKEDINLYCNYARAESKYIFSLGNKFDLIDVEINIDDDNFKKIIIELATVGKCLDEVFIEFLREHISKMEDKK